MAIWLFLLKGDIWRKPLIESKYVEIPDVFDRYLSLPYSVNTYKQPFRNVSSWLCNCKVSSNLWILTQHTLRLASIQTILTLYSGSNQAVCSHYTGSMQAAFRQHSDSNQSIFRQDWTRIQEVFGQYFRSTWAIQTVFRQYSGSIRAI